MEKVRRIASLIHASERRMLDDREQGELDEWLRDARNRALYEQLRDTGNVEKRMARMRQYDSKAAYHVFKKNVDARRGSRHFIRVARVACCLLPVAIGLYIWDSWPSGMSEPVVRESSYAQLAPGAKKAVLTLSGGGKVELGEKDVSRVIVDGNTEIRVDSSRMEYVFSGVSGERLYNSLEVPRKGEYTMTLADGSMVFLNSDSRLTYPVRFGKDSREVTLEGEAFFEIKRDSCRPFIVKSGKVRVTVLGTKFNLKTYAGEENVVTTLVEGKVVVSADGKQMVMKPGEQVCYSVMKDEMIKRDVDVSLYTSWRDGLFKFERESLDHILTTLARWYDVEIFYENASAKEHLFTGDLRRYSTIDEHLKMLEMTTNVHFSLQGNVVTVR